MIMAMSCDNFWQGMGRTQRASKGTEKFVQWKDPVPSTGDAGDFDGPESSSRVKKNRSTTRQKSLLSSLAASMQRPDIEEEQHGTSHPVGDSEAELGTSSPIPAEVQSSTPPPRFRPLPQVESTRRRGQPISCTEGETNTTAEKVPAVHNPGVRLRQSVLHQGDARAEEDGTEGSPQRRAPQGKRTYNMHE